MRLFRSQNKSQASLERPSESRDQSPIQSDQPAYSQLQQAFGGAYQHSPVLHQSQYQVQDERYYREDSLSTHPAPGVKQTHPNRAPSAAGDVHAQDQPYQPIVNVVPPRSPTTALPPQQPLPIQTNFGPLQHNRNDREPRKSKRGLFGFGGHKDKKEEKDYGGVDRRSVGRTSSVLKKHNPYQSPPQDSPQSPIDTSNENLPGIEQFYRPHDHHTSPHGQESSQQTVRYVDDDDDDDDSDHPTTPRHRHQPSLQSQRGAYRYEEQSTNNSDSYLPYDHQQRLYDQQSPLRPPSQSSLGPPSPLTLSHQLVTQPHGSRPNTSSTQARYSDHDSTRVQSQPQHDHLPPHQPHRRQPSSDQDRYDRLRTEHQAQAQSDKMGRGETSNGEVRSRREAREEERHHYTAQDPRSRTQMAEQGRNTPPPRNREDLSSLDYHQLLAKHEELQQKYSKVKRYYFEREAQVTQLQNTIASQRLSMSKTSLDDAQYTTRFERLNGAIQNLSFNVRKEWRRIPNWLAPVCNRDAHSVGTKEMTAIGRACITRWLYQSIFERVFHPGVDPALSLHLKNVERSLRRSQYTGTLTSEQQDDLMTKITTWRLTTIEGLGDILHSRQSEANQEHLIGAFTKQLTDYMRAFLVEPPPPGLADNLHTIIAQTISIISNMPLESRDISVEYYLPASHVSETYMRIEPGMTPLQHPGSAPSSSDHVAGLGISAEDDEMSTNSSLAEHSISNDPQSLEDRIREASAKGTSPNPAAAQTHSQRQESISGSSSSLQAGKKSGGFMGFVNKKPTPTQLAAGNTNMTLADPGKSGESTTDGYNLQSLTNGQTEGKIRFAAFLAVEIRGRSILTNSRDSSNKEKAGDNKDGAGGLGGGTASNATLGPGNDKSDGKDDKRKGEPLINVLCKAPVYCFE